MMLLAVKCHDPSLDKVEYKSKIHLHLEYTSVNFHQPIFEHRINAHWHLASSEVGTLDMRT